jgi:hypothetical protein
MNRCAQCGAGLTAADLTRSACAHCGTALPHHVLAAQKAALVREILADRNGDGVPDVFQGMGATAGTPASSGVTVVGDLSGGAEGQVVVIGLDSTPVVSHISVEVGEEERPSAVARTVLALLAVVLAAGAFLLLFLLRLGGWPRPDQRPARESAVLARSSRGPGTCVVAGGQAVRPSGAAAQQRVAAGDRRCQAGRRSQLMCSLRQTSPTGAQLAVPRRAEGMEGLALSLSSGVLRTHLER